MHHPELMQHLLHLLLLMLPLEDMPQVQSSEISLQGHLHAKHSKIPSCSSADKLQRACVCVCERERHQRGISWHCTEIGPGVRHNHADLVRLAFCSNNTLDSHHACSAGWSACQCNVHRSMSQPLGDMVLGCDHSVLGTSMLSCMGQPLRAWCS